MKSLIETANGMVGGRLGSVRLERRLLMAAFLLLGAVASNGAGEAAPAWPPVDANAMSKWQDKRFGMFIHWGPVSLTAHEIGWSRGAETPIEVYDNLYRQFNPTNFDARAWVKVAKDAGMKYIVLTTKHHDGFCLWDTKLTDYNIMRSPFGRDVVKELSAACRKAGIAFGTYYSTCDWHHPDFPLTSPGGRVKRPTYDLDAYNRYLLGQVSELITNYGPLITMWNDVPQMFQGRGAETIKLVRRLQPDITINNRTGDGGDYDTPEQRIGKFQMDRPWESCMTISAHNAWAWGGTNDGVKSLAACLGMVIRGAGGNGNVLLNVGPRPDGRIDPEQAGRLKEVGAWMAKYGESIYGTRGGPWKPTRAIASTRKGNTVYLHLLDCDSGRVELPDLPARIKSARVLGGAKARVASQDGKLVVEVPPPAPGTLDTIVKLKLDRPAMDLPALTPGPDVKASASNVYQNASDEYGPQEAFDNDPHTRWATDSKTSQAWIAADLGKPQRIGQVRIVEAVPYANRVTRFEFQYRAGSEWRTVFSGTTIGSRFQRRFPTVTAQEFRLNILDATDGPTLSEIELSE